MRLPRLLRRQDEPEQLIERQEEAGTSSAFSSQIEEFWANLRGVGFTPRLLDLVWTADRCIQLNAQQVSSMPLRFFGSREPAWVANPDPAWYPNGIGDAVFAAVASMYGWGDAFLLITSRYADGYPSAWTVLDPASMNVESRDGRRRYRSGQTWLKTPDVVQISRNPRAGSLRGSSALKSYASQAWGLVAASDLGRIMNQSAVPNTVIQSQRKIDAQQAAAIQEQWVAATSQRRGAPAVLGPDLKYETLSFSVADLMLLDVQKLNAQTIASAFGVPALFLNLPLEGGLNYQSPEMLGEHWWRFELRPMANFVARALSARMLPAGSYVEFDARDVLAPGFKELVDAWVELAKEGHASTEELRAAVLRLPADAQQEALAALTVPPSAGATPANQPEGVVALRPNQQVG